MENTTTSSVNVPPKLFKRNEHGLLEDPTIKYVFNEQGFIDWRKMIKPEFLVPNKQVFQRYNKPVPETTDGLQDNELLILLGGLKELAQIRGYEAVLPYKVVSPSSDYVIATASIIWIPNYETEGRTVQFSAIGDASSTNTNGFGRNYLGPIAENRAFVRAIRNFLRINIVSQEEIGGTVTQEPIEDTSNNMLQEQMNKYGITFDSIKKKLIEENVKNAESFKAISDIPRFVQFELVERIKRKAAEQGKS
jgi:hypothetical protein